MSAMTDYLEWQFSSHLLGSGTFTKPGTIAIAITRDPPTDADTGSSNTEIANAGAYARQTLNPSANNWTDAIGTNGIQYNLAQITFPVATASWGWCSGILLCSSATYGAGQAYVKGNLTTPKLIDSGDQLIIAVSGIALTYS